MTTAFYHKSPEGCSLETFKSGISICNTVVDGLRWLEALEEESLSEKAAQAKFKESHKTVHESIVKFLIYCWFDSKENNFKTYSAFENFAKKNGLLKIFNAPLDPVLINKLEKKTRELPSNILDILVEQHQWFNSKFFENGKVRKKKAGLKGRGLFFTPKEISDLICREAIEDIENNKVIDLGCGTGRFLLSCLALAKDKNKALNNLYGIDIDPISVAITILRLADQFPKEQRLDVIKRLQNQIVVGNAVYGLSKSPKKEFSFVSAFKDVFDSQGGFDAVVMNPPYKVLKINKSDFFTTSTKGISPKILNEIYCQEKERVEEEKKFIRDSKLYTLSAKGMLNYYRLFLEIALKITNAQGSIGAIIPSTLLGDSTAFELRKALLLDCSLNRVHFFKEQNRLFENVSQSLIIVQVKKGGKTSKVESILHNNNDEKILIDLDDIVNTFPKLEIPLLNSVGWSILKKLNSFEKLKDFSLIKNKRGELDMTEDKGYITETGLPLIRGKDIKGLAKKVFVQKKFLTKVSHNKVMDIPKERIVGQQIANVDLIKKLNFVIVPENSIVANSCNYILSEDKRFPNEVLVKLLNSKLLNWRFKISNYNNHISNYELGQLPIIIPKKPILSAKNEETIEEEIFKQYGLNSREINYITAFYNGKVV